MPNESSLEAFQRACGSSRKWTADISDSARGLTEIRDIIAPFALIGRQAAADIPLEHSQVSRHHAFVQIIEGFPFCFDLESRTGTRWADGRRFSGWLGGNEVIQIGPYQIGVQVGGNGITKEQAGFDPLQPLADASRPFSGMTLEFVNGAARMPCWRIDRSLTLLGSAPGCKLRLRSRSASRFHAYILAIREGFWLVDLLSAAGTLHNGEPVRFARLEDGDQILAGGFLIRCHQAEFKARRASVPLARQNREMEGLVESGQTLSALNEASETSALSQSLYSPLSTVRYKSTGNELVGPVEDSRLMGVMNQFSQMQMQMFDQFQQTLMMMFQMFGNLQKEQMAALRQELDQVRELTRELQALKDSVGRGAQPESTTTSYHTPPDPASETATHSAPPPSQAPRPHPKAQGDGKSPGDLHALLYQRMEVIEQERQNRWQKILGLLGAQKQ